MNSELGTLFTSVMFSISAGQEIKLELGILGAQLFIQLHFMTTHGFSPMSPKLFVLTIIWFLNTSYSEVAGCLETFV